MALFLARSAPRCSVTPATKARVSIAQPAKPAARVSLTKRAYADAAGASANAEAASKINSYKELLTKRDQRNRDIVSQIGGPVDSTPAAQQAQQWYWLAFSEKRLSQVEQDVTKIEEFASKNAEFGSFLARGSLPPTLATVQGDQVPANATRVFTGADGKQTAVLPTTRTTKDLVNELVSGARLSDVTNKFLQNLEATGNLKDLRAVIDKFRQKHAERAQGTGVVEATLTLASAWPEAEINKLLNQFLERNPQYRSAQIKLQTKVDPSIMGGFKLKIADRFVDKSEKADYEKAVKQQELQTTGFYQRLEEAATWQPHIFWQGPYANDSEFLEAMEDKYGDDTIEAVQKMSTDVFEQVIKSGEKHPLVHAALQFAQPPSALQKKISNMVYYKPKDLPLPTVDELIADWQKVRSVPAGTPRL